MNLRKLIPVLLVLSLTLSLWGCSSAVRLCINAEPGAEGQAATVNTAEGGTISDCITKEYVTEEYAPEEYVTEEHVTEQTVTEGSSSEQTVTEGSPSEQTVTEGSSSEQTVSEVNASEQTATATPLLYRVTDGKGGVLWLFGSIHVGRKDYYPLPDYVMDAFNSSSALAVEFDVISFEKNILKQVSALGKLIYSDNTSLKDHIPEELYNETVRILSEHNLYSSSTDRYKPVFCQSLIQNCGHEKMELNGAIGVDRYLLSLAKSERKRIIEVESAKEQFGILASFSEELQQMLLQSTIHSYNNLDSARRDMEYLLELWYEGDERKLTDYMNANIYVELPDSEEYLPVKEYNDKIYAARNEKMTERALKELSSGKEVFFCVGAAHIVGDGALAQQLSALGYTVEAVGCGN